MVATVFLEDVAIFRGVKSKWIVRLKHRSGRYPDGAQAARAADVMLREAFCRDYMKKGVASMQLVLCAIYNVHLDAFTAASTSLARR